MVPVSLFSQVACSYTVIPAGGKSIDTTRHFFGGSNGTFEMAGGGAGHLLAFHLDSFDCLCFLFFA